MQSASNAIFALDLQRRFTLVNQRTCEITGYGEQELLGASYQMLYTSQTVAAVDRQFDHVAREGGTVSQYETPLVRKDGSHVTITFSIVPLMRDGRIVGVVGTAEDITERKRAETELAARAEELARSNAELEQFAHIASHDLQAPLRGVIGFSQLLEQDYGAGLDANGREYIGLIVQSATRMRSLITDLLTFSRVGKQDAERTAVACEEVMAQVEAQLASVIEARHAVITHDPLPVVTSTPLEMGQLFQNLVSNAIKYQPGDAPSVHVSARRSNGGWTFSFSDRGIGISPQHQERIFQIFQRLHTADQYEGTGIGLAICRKIVDRHGGRIWVESEEGDGATFYFTLPDAAAPAPAGH
jgi:PAS domain S-box-containing protein